MDGKIEAKKPLVEGVILKPEDFGSTRNTELAACLVTLGFELLNGSAGFARVIGDGIAAPGGAVTWYFSKRSRDGRYTLGEVLARWDDWDWLNSDTQDPLAYVITAFHNKRRLVDEIKRQEVMVLVRTGRRYALFAKNAGRQTMEKVGRFMGM